MAEPLLPGAPLPSGPRGKEDKRQKGEGGSFVRILTKNVISIFYPASMFPKSNVFIVSLICFILFILGEKFNEQIVIPAVPPKWFGSAACNSIYISICPSVHKQLIRTILEVWQYYNYSH